MPDDGPWGTKRVEIIDNVIESVLCLRVIYIYVYIYKYIYVCIYIYIYAKISCIFSLYLC